MENKQIGAVSSQKNGHHFYDNFFNFLKDSPHKRCERSEKELIEAFSLRYEFGLVGYVQVSEQEFITGKILQISLYRAKNGKKLT